MSRRLAEFPLWATSLENKNILLYINNNALVSIVNKRSSKDTWSMKMILPFVLITMKHNVQFKAIHIESANKPIARTTGTISRNDIFFIKCEFLQVWPS
jgi:hypothetical protein